MKEGKIDMDNGDELPVFFLKKQEQESNMETENTPPPNPAFMPTSQDASIPIEYYNHPMSNIEKKDMIQKLLGEINSSEKYDLDDTIPSDYISNPIKGEIYKAKGLNTICRYVSNDGEYHHLDFHNSSVYLKMEDNELLKSSELEKSLYEENEKL